MVAVILIKLTIVIGVLGVVVVKPVEEEPVIELVQHGIKMIKIFPVQPLTTVD